MAVAWAGQAELEQGPCLLQQCLVLLLVPWAAGMGSCHAAGAPAPGSSTAPELPLHPDQAPSARGISRDTKQAGKGWSTGELLARFAIHGTNLSEIHFRRKNIFNSTVCNHLIKVIRSESPRNNVQRCVTAELAAAFIRTAQTRLGHLMDWSGSAHSNWGDGLLLFPQQAALPAPALPAPALPAPSLVPGQSRGMEGLRKWLSLPAFSLLLPSFGRKTAGHGQTCVTAL